MADRSVSDTWERGDPYERYVGRWSRQVAPRFVAWLGVPPGRRWLDVGCGTGALSAAILDQAAPAALTAVEPSGGFLETARRHLGPRAVLHQGSATALPLPDASVDVVVSGLVLNFVPEPPAALAEMRRVTARGGTVAAYVWDYAEGMQLMRAFWDAAVAEDPAAAALDEGTRFPLCRPAALTAAFNQVSAFSLPANSKDAALLTTLDPGQYTVQVTGVGGTTGVAIVEIYEVQ